MNNKDLDRAKHIFKFSENDLADKIQQLNRSLQAYKRSHKDIFKGVDLTKPISEINLAEPAKKLQAVAKSGAVCDAEAKQMHADAELWSLLPYMIRDRNHYRAMQDKLADLQDGIFQPEPETDMFDADKNPFIQIQRLEGKM